MNTTFFIIPDSFKYDGSPQSKIEAKIKNFAIDLNKIKDHDGNEILCSTDIYDIDLFKGISVSDILNNPNISQEKLIDRDVVQQLRVIWELKETTYSTQEIYHDLIPNHDINQCYGIIAFNPIVDIPIDYQLVYGIDEWYKFKRFFLGIYPLNVNYFIDECKIYFESLFFHERNKDSIKVLFPSCINRVIHHLSELNDKFLISKSNPYNRINTLKKFNAIYVHDGQEASIEGNIKRKKDLTFIFNNKNNNEQKVYCELHLKLSVDDSGTFDNNRRIYFYEGESSIADGKILIAHIGKHL